VHDACRREVIDLHRFFVGWLGGDLPDDEESFDRVRRVLADGFAIVTPDGQRSERLTLLEGLRAARGRRPGLRIWIEAFQGREISDGLFLATYEEWQQESSAPHGRLSSALFRRASGAPQGVDWLHVHETWLERGAEP